MRGKKVQTGTPTGRAVRRKDLQPAREPSDEVLLRAVARAAKAAQIARSKARRAETTDRETRRNTP